MSSAFLFWKNAKTLQTFNTNRLFNIRGKAYNKDRKQHRNGIARAVSHEKSPESPGLYFLSNVFIYHSQHGHAGQPPGQCQKAIFSPKQRQYSR